MTRKKITIGIIGLGRFGILVSSILSKHFDVFAYHYRDGADVIEKAKKAGVKLASLEKVAGSDVVITVAPIANTEEYLNKIAKYVKDGALIVDTCTVKTLPCQWLEKHITKKEVEIMGVHPMFGPCSTCFDMEKQSWKLDGLQIVLCPLRITEKRLVAIKKFLNRLKLEVIETTPEDHDRQTAITIGLVHYAGRSLWEAGIRDQKIHTPGFKKLTSIFCHTVTDSWGLFYDMHNFNPYAEKVRKDVISAFQKIDRQIKDNNRLDEK